MATKTEMYYQDLYTTRMNIVEMHLRKETKKVDQIKDFPELIEISKSGKLSTEDRARYKEMFGIYKYLLNELLAYAVSDMYYRKSKLDISALFSFVLGGSVNKGKYVDHVTNNCFSHLFSAVQIFDSVLPVADANNTSINAQMIKKHNDFNAISIKKSEENYVLHRTPPPFGYLLLAFPFNISVMEDRADKYFNDKNIDGKKYYVFVDMFDDRTTINALQLDKKAVYTDVFFRFYLDELMTKLKSKISTMGDDFSVKKDNVKLYDPSQRG